MFAKNQFHWDSIITIPKKTLVIEFSWKKLFSKNVLPSSKLDIAFQHSRICLYSKVVHFNFISRDIIVYLYMLIDPSSKTFFLYWKSDQC